MSITVHQKTLGSFYWQVEGSNLVLKNLVNRQRDFWAINPKVINDLSGNKSSTFSQAQLDSNFTFTTSSDISLLAANYADSVWSANGWTVGTDATFIQEVKTFISNNYGQQSINANLQDLVVVITRGSIGGTDYSIPFCFVGNKGDPAVNGVDSYTKALLHLDGNVTDYSSKGKTPVLAGRSGGIFTTGKFDQGYNCQDGQGIMYSVNDPDHQLGTGDFTVEGFIYVAAANNNRSHYIWGHGASGIGGWDLRLDSGGTVTFVSYSASISFSASSAVTADTWTHVALTRESGVFKIWVNGLEKASLSDGRNLNDTDSRFYLHVAAYTQQGMDGSNCVIDEFRFSKGIARYTANFTPISSPFSDVVIDGGGGGGGGNTGDTILLMHFDNNITDSSTVANTTTSNGTITYDSSGKFSQGYAPQPGTLVWVDPNSPNFSTNFDFTTGDFTVEAWIKLNSSGSGGIVFAQGQTYVNSGFYFAVDAAAVRMRILQFNNSIDGYSAVSIGEWHHVAMVRNGTVVRLFLDGTIVGVDYNFPNFSFNASYPACIGSLYVANGNYPAGAPFSDGSIDEVRVSKIARWTSNFTPPNSPY